MAQELRPQESDFLLYTTPAGDVRVDVLFADETVWLTQKRMAELFGVEISTVNYHLKEIFKSKEVQEEATIRKFRMVQYEGNREVIRDLEFYNLDVIISVGYRVNSEKATRFRTWATKTLRTYIVKGYALDDERLKNGQHFGKDYFEELLEKIREIRASERRFYQKITDLYAEGEIRETSTCKEFLQVQKEAFAGEQARLPPRIASVFTGESCHAPAGFPEGAGTEA